ncbi:MAG: MFS transporter [Bacteroidetes bacterium GWF2_42_66]|nr:MAG: MFS transporter [Bacteroidetes bacterium GWA2_42_15]OFY03207.1 MAG: MFS transporter [Bacteroidetes bacterium GWE2_42_39]OFY43407.1 MAG: MFS transporter [Bacteroidetes bacterium GWF2_42_66]HBL77535.1 MFS transporter [Prolixibacteraceae bacterium]HCR89877.1 MFS transporter [Prolixibacteraceae bacterium]
MNQNKNYTLPIIMMILLFGMISFVTNLAAPMGIVLKEQFSISNFLGLLGNAANFIAYAVMGIPGGIMLQRLGYKKTALIAIAIGFVGVFIQYLSGYASESLAFGVYLLGAFVAGFSMCLLNTVVNPMLNTLGGGGNKGNQLIQVGGSFNSVMATFTPAFVGILIGEATKAQITDVFPVMYIAMAIFAVVFFVLFAVSIPEPHAEKSSEPLGNLMSGALKFRHFVLGAIAIFVYVGVEVGTPGIMNLWLSDTEVGKTTAGFVAGTYWFLMLVGRLFGASIGNKVSSKTMLTVASLLGMVLIACAIFSPVTSQVSLPVLQKSAIGGISFGLALVPINAMFIVLVGLCTSIMWGGIFNLAVEGLGKYLAAASGIFMVLVSGGGLLPVLQGKIADIAGYIPSYWVIFVCLAYLLFYALVGSKNVNTNIPVE